MLDNCKNRLPHCASRCQISTGWDWLACQLWSTVMMVEPRTLGVKVHPTTTKMKRTCWLADLENSMRPTILNSFWLLAARKWTRSWINMQQLKLSSITLSCDNQVKHCWHVWLNDFWRVQRSSWLKRVNTLKLGILEHERHTSLGRCSAKENATNFCKQSKGFVVKHFFYCLLNVGCCNNPWLKESHSINICHILCSHWHHSFHSWCIVLSAWFVPLICCAGFVHHPNMSTVSVAMKNGSEGHKTLKRSWCIDVKRWISGCHYLEPIGCVVVLRRAENKNCLVDLRCSV